MLQAYKMTKKHCIIIFSFFFTKNNTPFSPIVTFLALKNVYIIFLAILLITLSKTLNFDLRFTFVCLNFKLSIILALTAYQEYCAPTYSVIPSLTNFSSVLRNAVSVTLAIFLFIQSYTLHHRNPGRTTRSTNKKQEKSKQNRSSWVREFQKAEWEF